MGILDLHNEQSDTGAPNPLQALPRTLGERIEATTAETFAPDRYFMSTGSRRDAWQRSVDELHAATGQTFQNPYGAVTPEEMMRLGNQPAVESERRQKIIDASRMARAQGNDDLYDPENIDRYIAEEAQRRRDKAARYVGTGNGIGNFVAGMALETMTPHGVAGLLIPVTRLPTAASSIIGQTFLRNVARETVFQGAANAGLQAAAEGLDFMSRRDFGTQQTAGEILENVAGAAIIGGAIGGGVRALHLKWLGLPEKVRAEAPLAVKDAFQNIELDALYSSRNRLGLPPLLHERYQGRANDAVMRGTPVDLSDLARAGDTPMTALGTILRMAPDTIRPGGIAGPLERVRSLPDSEMESFAREMKPDSFRALDSVDARLAALETRRDAIQHEADQIGVADVIDLDTAALLNDIEERLRRPALRRAERLQLEHERAQWIQTLDVHGRLTDDLVRMRREFFPEHGPALRALAEERAALMRERAAAQSVVKGEVDALRRKLESISFGRRFADDVSPDVLARELETTPVDLAAALQRADFERQATIAQEAGFFASRAAEGGSTGVPKPGSPGPDVQAGGVKKGQVPPEQVAALDNQVKQSLLDPTVAGREVSVDGVAMSAARAMEETDRMAKDAATAMQCVLGVPL